VITLVCLHSNKKQKGAIVLPMTPLSIW